MSDVPHDRRVERLFPVRTYDIDFSGMVSNLVYVRWLEDLRLALLDEAYPVVRGLQEDVAPILLGTKISYGRALTLRDRPRGRIWVTGLARLRWSVAAEFVTDETVHATAEQSGIFIRLSTGRPTTVPEPLRARYASIAALTPQE